MSFLSVVYGLVAVIAPLGAIAWVLAEVRAMLGGRRVGRKRLGYARMFQLRKR